MKTIYDEAMKELQDYINEYGMDYYATNHFPKTIKALERAKKVEEFISLCYVETTDTGHEVVFWRDENYEYAKQLLKILKGGTEMKLKSVKRYVRYKRHDGILELLDTQFDGDSMFGRDYKVDDDDNLFVGNRYYNRVNDYTCIGKFILDSDVLYVEEAGK